MSAIITFNADGNGHCLYTEAILLGSIGTLEIKRATNIEFNDHTQLWEIRDAKDNGILYQPNCLHSLVSALQGLAGQTEAMRILRGNARASLARFPTWDECSRRMLAVYGQIARNAPR